MVALDYNWKEQKGKVPVVTYPIHIDRAYYRGADKNKQRIVAEENRIAADLERKINELLLRQTAPIKVYGWGEIARETGYAIPTVTKYGFSIDCGSNGFTAYRHDLSYDQALVESN